MRMTLGTLLMVTSTTAGCNNSAFDPPNSESYGDAASTTLLDSGTTFGASTIHPTTEEAETVSDSEVTSTASTEGTTSASSSTTFPSSSCGDGRLDEGEECDDGNLDSTDECTELCRAHRCGDGFIHQPDEKCDDGNINNFDSCTSKCEPASCGDGFAQTFDNKTEECDDGNDNNTDACTTACKNAACGDGYVQTGEECDNADDNLCTDQCKILCQWDAMDPCACDTPNTPGNGCHDNQPARLIFVTSELYQGQAIGGVENADEHCQNLANAVNFKGKFRAWLSSLEMGPKTHFAGSTLTNLPLIRMDGKIISKDWNALLSLGTPEFPNLINPITLTELWPPKDKSTSEAKKTIVNAENTPYIWTGSHASGDPSPWFTCINWSLPKLLGGIRGQITTTDQGWSDDSSSDCANEYRLVCIQYSLE